MKRVKVVTGRWAGLSGLVVGKDQVNGVAYLIIEVGRFRARHHVRLADTVVLS